ncbi:Na+/H+ antiporter NhaC family protein [Atopobium fossor]|uniref:Na+/H+ antiporter NhaC family protein n=1 Tax=Atopobium fossor TaxID=39487 RepID=UPI0003F97EB2|nr:Na+/H+ antiporter NhaC family protein [Atopobium fossor]
MIETIVLIAFASILISGIIIGTPLLTSLLIGLALFAGYGLWRGHSTQELVRMALSGVKTVSHVLILFAIIGMLTATWRAAGTIPFITSWSAALVKPSTIVVTSFLICCGMSFLCGSSFGAAATAGVACFTIGEIMGANTSVLGGAILSGCFFGDRCSPMSSSAALVGNLTRTNVQENIGRMMRSAAVPLILSCIIFAALGMSNSTATTTPNFSQAFSSTFVLSPIVLIPIVIVLIFSFAHVSVKKTMLVSLASAIAICILVQHMSILDIPSMLLFGFKTSDQTIASMVNGGGIVSMFHLACIVSVASTYSGIFNGTGLLDKLRCTVKKISKRTTPFIGVLLTAIITAIIACDQVVCIMLTAQLCDGCEGSGSALALDIENSSVIIPALVPWSTSVIGILAFVGAPSTSILFALYAILVPAWTVALSVYEYHHPEFVESKSGQLMGLNRCDDIRLVGESMAA